MKRYRLCRTVIALALGMLVAGEACARVKLITLPVRDRVAIRLDHPDATLVEEERLVPLTEGYNQVDFSWANTRIDPSTVVFRVLGGGEERVRVMSVSYPPQENALVWTVYAAAAGPARVRISYLVGNLTRSFNYRALASKDESHLQLSQYMRITNLANEAYGESELWLGYGEHSVKPVGLDETREILVRRHTRVPIRKTYSVDPAELGYLDAAKGELRVAMHYVLANSEASGMGQAALPPGKVRIFQRDGHGGTAFLGEDWGRYAAPEDELSLYLGLARDVVVKRVIERNERERVAGELFHQHVVLRYELENFKETPVTVSLIEDLRRLRSQVLKDTGRGVQWTLGPETTFESAPDTERTTEGSLVVQTPLPAASDGTATKVVRKLHLIIQNEW